MPQTWAPVHINCGPEPTGISGPSIIVPKRPPPADSRNTTEPWIRCLRWSCSSRDLCSKPFLECFGMSFELVLAGKF